MLSLACLMWSIVTYLHSYAKTVNQMVVLRVALGGFHAFFGPAAYSLVSDLFPKQKRARAFFIYSILIQLGDAISALTINLIVQVGWRMSY